MVDEYLKLYEKLKELIDDKANDSLSADIIRFKLDDCWKMLTIAERLQVDAALAKGV